MIETMNQKFYTAKNDKVFKAVMCDEEDDRRILNTEKKLSFMEGEEKGLAIGKKQTQLETAKKMKEEGIEVSIISKITSLSLEEIESL